MKGPKLNEEIKQSQKAIEVLGLEVERVEKITLPNTDMDRNILVLKKITRISEEYPRKTVNIKKNPL